MKHLSGRRGWGTIHCGWKINITSCNTVSQQLLWLGIFLLKYSNFKIMTNLKNALNCKCRLLCVECEGGADFMAFDQVIWAKKVFWKKCTFMLTPILFQDEKPPHAFFLINRNLNKGMVRKYCSEFFVPCSFIQRVLFSYMQTQFICWLIPEIFLKPYRTCNSETLPTWYEGHTGIALGEFISFSSSDTNSKSTADFSILHYS